MSNDDSFNDSDEMFSLYSSKNVRETFKAQLKKIVANHHQNKVVVNNGDTLSNETNDNDIEKPSEICKKPKEAITSEKPVEPIVLLEDESPTSVNYNDNSAENSIEIVTEFTPVSSARRSERLRKKAQSNPVISNQQNHNSGISDGPGNRRITRSKSRGKRQSKKKVIDEVTLDDSSQESENDELNLENDDEFNPEVSVKVIWKSVNLKKFQIRKFQKLSYIFEQLSKEENIPQDKLILSFDNVRVSPSDTPDSLNLQVYHFLHGGELSELSNLCHTPKSQDVESNSDSVLLKFQDANKKIIKVVLNKHEKLRVGMIKCSEQLEIPINKIKFLFDGETLEPHETPDSLGLENEEIIDFKICE